MIQLKDTKPLSDFLSDSSGHIAGLKESGRPEVLTVNGEAAVVIQDVEAYRELIQLAQQGLDDARLANALEAYRGGEQGIPVERAFAQLRKEVAGG